MNWTIGGLSDFNACRKILDNAVNYVPWLIILTSRTMESDRVLGLISGADDYVSKPFSPRELLTRIRALLRRRPYPSKVDVLRYADVEMDLVARTVKRGGNALFIRPTQFNLLRHFLTHPHRVWSRDELRRAICTSDCLIELRSIDGHIRHLRKALNKDGLADLIRTARVAGYALDVGDGF
jgi:two-component system phosphate regulon response regulator PhoB